MSKKQAPEPNPFFSAIIDNKNEKEDLQVFLGNLYWQRKTAEAIASQKIAEAELEKVMSIVKDTIPIGDNLMLSENAKQALNNQTIYSYLKAVDKKLDNVDGDISRKIFSGDDR